MGLMVWSSNPGRCKRFFFSPKHPHRLWGPPSLILLAARVFTGVGVKQPGSAVNQSPPSSTKAKRNRVIYTFTPPTYRHGMDRENLNLYLFTFAVKGVELKGVLHC
jgi:hypothetical protein